MSRLCYPLLLHHPFRSRPFSHPSPYSFDAAQGLVCTQRRGLPRQSPTMNAPEPPHPHPPHNATLEPLDVDGLLPPFHPINPSQSELPHLDSPVFDETPTTATAPLPTPRVPDVIPCIQHPSVSSPNTTLLDPSSIHGQSDQSTFLQPPAPRMKEYDSFTEGTTPGSFDLSLRSSWSSEHFPERSLSREPPTSESVIESWLRGIPQSPTSLPPSSSTLPSEAMEDEGDEVLFYGPDFSSRHRFDPEDWSVTPTRAPKRQLSYNSVDGDHSRGRKLIRHSIAGGRMPAVRSCSRSIVDPSRLDTGDGGHQGASVDRLQSGRSSSAPSVV